VIHRSALALSLLLAPTLATAQPFTDVRFPTLPDSSAVEFTTPSGNIGCIYIPAGGTKVYRPRDGGPELSCDRPEPKYVHVSLARSGKAKQIVNPGEQGCCSDTNKLGYGQRWSGGPFICESTQNGLTCKRNDGRGFSISRAAIKLF
jgi:hypothetical protein